MNRSDFFKRLGVGLGAAVIMPSILVEEDTFAQAYDEQWKEDEVVHFTEEELRDEYLYTGGYE